MLECPTAHHCALWSVSPALGSAPMVVYKRMSLCIRRRATYFYQDSSSSSLGLCISPFRRPCLQADCTTLVVYTYFGPVWPRPRNSIMVCPVPHLSGIDTAPPSAVACPPPSPLRSFSLALVVQLCSCWPSSLRFSKGLGVCVNGPRPLFRYWLVVHHVVFLLVQLRLGSA